MSKSTVEKEQQEREKPIPVITKFLARYEYKHPSKVNKKEWE